jgi:rhodanese-related sulfurtransferase
MKTPSPISPTELQSLIASGQCQVIDVREPVEHAEMSLPCAKLIPLGELDRRCSEFNKSGPLVVMCRGGTRGEKALAKLSAQGFTDVRNLDGGILAWKSAGLPVDATSRRGLPLMQQTQLIIGIGVLTGSILAVTVDPRFAFISAFFGSGLILAGSTGWCGLALLLAKMPWNNVSNTAAGTCCATK